MIPKKTIESQYNKMLAFSYGNISKLIFVLKKTIDLYNNSKNKGLPVAKYRIELYTEVLKYAKLKNE